MSVSIRLTSISPPIITNYDGHSQYERLGFALGGGGGILVY